MKLFKKLDDYLLHHYPSIWITRIHSFLPIGIGIAGLLYLITLTIGWSPKDEMPQDLIPIVLMIIPVLIYLVYWFVFQSRYNIAKSGVNMPMSFEYLNFFSYLLVFFVAFLIISAIPLANYQKVKNAINEEELILDIKNLNAGNALVNGGSEIIYNLDGSITYYPSDFVYPDYYYSYDYSYTNEIYEPASETTISRKTANQIVSDYIKSYNQYTQHEITKSASQILSENEAGDYQYNDYGYDYYSGYESNWEVQNKLSQIQARMYYGWYGEYSEPWFWKICIGLLAFMSILVWIFKQMKLRQFVFGFIAICVTPLLIGIIGVIIFELLQIRSNEEEVVSGLVLFFYLIFAFVAMRGFKQGTLNNLSYVMTMYLQFFLPLIPVFLWLFFIGESHYPYDTEENMLNMFYWSGWLIGLSGIFLFKPMYAKFRSLPSKN
jgi:hypothetical protein